MNAFFRNLVSVLFFSKNLQIQGTRATDALSQDLPVRMTALGRLVFILAFLGITRSALIVPFWQHQPEVSRQQQQEILTPEPEEEHPQKIHYQEEDLKAKIVFLEHLLKFSPFKNLRISNMLRLF